MQQQSTMASYIGQCSECGKDLAGQPPNYLIRYWVEDSKKICDECKSIDPPPIGTTEIRKSKGRRQ